MDNMWIAALAPADRKRIEPHLHERPFEQGQMLYDAGEAVEEVWFPMSGVVSLMIIEDDVIFCVKLVDVEFGSATVVNGG